MRWEQMIQSLGYQEYPATQLHDHENRNFQKKISKGIIPDCETNDKSFLNVNYFRDKSSPTGNLQVEIIQENHGVWWKVSAYSISEDEFTMKLLCEIEDRLLSFFQQFNTQE